MESRGQQLIGTTLGTCTLERLIGVGGMGVVYVARQTRPAREVAVKVLRLGTGAQPEEQRAFLLRFRREADVVARLDHIHIMPIYEYGEQEDVAYLVMPYLTGGNLRDRLKERGPLSPEQTLDYLEQVASALDYAHAQRVVHRDIKPGNLLFHADGRLVLADFGIARMMIEHDSAGGVGGVSDATLTTPGQIIGSVEYMAPEMVSGQPTDARTDIYELGILLFQMLTGRVPFQAATSLLIAAKQVQEQPPHLYEIDPHLSPELDAVVQKALAKRKEQRFASAGELARAFRLALVDPQESRKTLAVNEATQLVSPQPIPLPPSSPSLPLPPPTSASYPSHATYPPSQTSPSSPSQPSQPFQAFVPAEAYPPPAQAQGSGGMYFQPTPQAQYDQYAPYAAPGQPGQATPPPSRRRTVWPLIAGIAALCLIALLGVGILLGSQFVRGGGQPTPTPTPSALTPTQGTTPAASPTLTPAQQAQAVVQHYYDDINQANYQAAYQLWGADYQHGTSYDQFAAGFAQTKHDDIVFRAVSPQSDGTVKTDVTLYATQAAGAGTTVAVYQGSYTVGIENGAWKLLTSQFQQVNNPTPTPTSAGQSPPPQVKGTLQAYYQAINAKDYHSAYALWGADYQHTNPYDQFAKGFAQTKHDDVSFGTITQLDQTTYRVELTVVATESSASGSVQHTYGGSYVVGQENGAWKLLSADFGLVH